MCHQSGISYMFSYSNACIYCFPPIVFMQDGMEDTVSDNELPLGGDMHKCNVLIMLIREDSRKNDFDVRGGGDHNHSVHKPLLTFSVSVFVCVVT